MTALAKRMIRRRCKYPLSLLLILCLYAGIACADAVIDISSIELLDESGGPVTLNSYAGHYQLVFFGYTYCPDICPLTLYYVAAAMKSLGPLADKLKVVFISVDPKRDTPQILARYTDAFHPSIKGHTGTYDQIAAAAAGFRTTFGYNMVVDGKERPLSRQEYEALSPAASYVPYHSSQIYLLDNDGELVDIIGHGSRPDAIEATLRGHLDG